MISCELLLDVCYMLDVCHMLSCELLLDVSHMSCELLLDVYHMLSCVSHIVMRASPGCVSHVVASPRCVSLLCEYIS